MGKKQFSLSAVLALLAVLLAAVTGSAAYLLTRSGTLENRFAYAEVSCEVRERFDGSTKEQVQILNTGTVPALFRAAYVISWVDDRGDIAAAVPPGYGYELKENPGGTWVKGEEGFFYYLSPVAPGEATAGSLLTCRVICPENPEYRLSVEVIASALQAEPAQGVQEAWGVSPGKEEGT